MPERGTIQVSRITTALVVALSTFFFVALHWRGIPLSPDGWAYWQAAASLANGSGYRDFSGTPLTAWPPLYSLYLSLWVRLLGATGFALVVANGVLILAQSVLWFHTVSCIWCAEPRDRRLPVALGVALYVALFVPLTLQAAHSANLGFLCAGFMILATWQTGRSDTLRNRVVWLTASVVAGALALLAHNVNLALVAACSGALLITRRKTPLDFAFAALLLLVPMALWISARWYLGQLGSHPVGIGIANFDATQYAAQMAFVVGNLIVPSALGAPFVVSAALLAWCIWALFAPKTHRNSTAAKFVAAVVLIGSVLILLLFSLTAVADPIGQRFVGWVPILVIPAMLIRAARIRVATLMVAVALVLTPNIHRFVIFSTVHADLSPTQEIGVLFPIGAFISREYPSGPPVPTSRGLLIAPP